MLLWLLFITVIISINNDIIINDWSKLKIYCASKLSNKNEKIYEKIVFVGCENLKIRMRGLWLINDKIAHEF